MMHEVGAESLDHRSGLACHRTLAIRIARCGEYVSKHVVLIDARFNPMVRTQRKVAASTKRCFGSCGAKVFLTTL